MLGFACELLDMCCRGVHEALSLPEGCGGPLAADVEQSIMCVVLDGEKSAEVSRHLPAIRRDLTQQSECLVVVLSA